MIRSTLDPPIPYVGPITINPGTLIRIQGIVLSMAYRFNINLQCGPETLQQDNIALQIAIKVLDGFITLNSLKFGIWGHEQHVSVSPIKRAEEFEIIIFNKQYSYEFPERIPYHRISHLAIDGDVSIIRISCDETVSSDRLGKASTSNSIGPSASSEEFELNSIGAATSSYKMRRSPVPEASAPPSYKDATSNNPPYPTNSTVGMPFTTSAIEDRYTVGGGKPASMGINIPPDANLSASTPPGAHVPLNAYPSSDLPPGAPVPLNAPNSTFRPIKRWSPKQYWCITGIVLFVLVTAVVVPLRVMGIIKPRSH